MTMKNYFNGMRLWLCSHITFPVPDFNETGAEIEYVS
jgi:hypothetical protein